MLKTTPEGRDTIERIHLLSGIGKENSKTFFESLLTLIILDYAEGEKTYLPFIGEISMNYKGDTYNGDFKKAIVDIDFKADDVLLRNIGQIQDNEETDIERNIEKKLQNALTDKLGK